jgi:hypothetical protein
MIFHIPAVDKFCRALRDGVTACGGPDKFFENLTNDHRQTIRKALPDYNDVQILRALIHDDSYRADFISQIPDETDRTLINELVQGWKVWSKLSPQDAEDFDLYTLDSRTLLLDENVPTFVNDITSCTTILSLDANFEEFLVKSALKLYSPNKKIGGENIIVMAGTLLSFIGTIRLMINAIKLRTNEKKLFNISDDTKIIQNVVARLDDLQKAVSDVRAQFENMKAG